MLPICQSSTRSKVNRFPNIVIGLPPVGLFAALMFLITSLLRTGLLIILSNTVAGIDVLRAIQKLLLVSSFEFSFLIHLLFGRMAYA